MSEMVGWGDWERGLEDKCVLCENVDGSDGFGWWFFLGGFSAE